MVAMTSHDQSSAVTAKVTSRSRSPSLRRATAGVAVEDCAVPVTQLRASLQALATENGEPALKKSLPPCLEEVYGKAGHESAIRTVQVLVRACDEFIQTYGEKSVHIVRSPARINLRGMHIDNNGGYTNSILLDREVFIVFAVTPPADAQPCIQLRNLDSSFSPNEVSMPLKATEDDVKASVGWTKYVAAAILALEQVASVSNHSSSLCGVVASSCPAGVGLSSSHAFVLCVLNALLHGTGSASSIDPTTELRAAQRAEHLTGIKSGLMDQGSMIFGQRGSLLHARFYDLKVHEIASTIKHCPWPEDCAVVVANSKVVRQLAQGVNAAKYGLPRLGCAIAMPMLRAEAAKRGLAPDDEMSWGIAATLSLLKAIPAAAPLSELLQTFPAEQKAGIEAAVQRFIPGGSETLGDMPIPLRGSTLFTLSESARGKEFFAALQRGDLATCGKLMDVGHEGDAPDGDLHISDENLDELAKEFAGSEYSNVCMIPGSFRAGHPRLDELCRAMRRAGAEGASLTGAGHGGCVVALFASNAKAKSAVQAVLDEFSDLDHNDVLIALPVQGRGLLDAVGLL